ncbi:MAG: peptidase [Cycloclasticus sp. symbiont of Bathymodiolus heckerae]|nr:MAG: peptidase [Cycloclasticus sp. symbiont of Bathymodiolus heckerae]
MIAATTTIRISIDQQILNVCRDGNVIKSYEICTAKNGVGEQFGSECTPRGAHIIRAKIGENAPVASVFVGRRLTGEIYNQLLGKECPDRDWILTRILWLSGCEIDKNRLGKVDTMRRYIYIHGAPDELVKGEPSSHGCIRMLNEDIVDLFDNIVVGTRILIGE